MINCGCSGSCDPSKCSGSCDPEHCSGSCNKKNNINVVNAILINQALELIASMNSNEREDFFVLLFDKYCNYCYDLLDGNPCNCWNDE